MYIWVVVVRLVKWFKPLLPLSFFRNAALDVPLSSYSVLIVVARQFGAMDVQKNVLTPRLRWVSPIWCVNLLLSPLLYNTVNPYLGSPLCMSLTRSSWSLSAHVVKRLILTSSILVRTV